MINKGYLFLKIIERNKEYTKTTRKIKNAIKPLILSKRRILWN